jgi:hypothetical protein
MLCSNSCCWNRLSSSDKTDHPAAAATSANSRFDFEIPGELCVYKLHRVFGQEQVARLRTSLVISHRYIAALSTWLYIYISRERKLKNSLMTFQVSSYRENGRWKI